MKQKQYGFVYVTAKSVKEAQKIAQACVEQKLCACVNIFPSVLSCYEWEGKYQEEQEAVFILKTRLDLFKKLCQVIKQHHSYTCPCIVFIPIAEGEKSFLSYIDNQTL